MTEEEKRAKNWLAVQKYRAKDPEAFKKYSREYQREYQRKLRAKKK